MKTSSSSINKALRTGLIFAVVVLFLILVGFPVAGSALLARFLGKAPEGGTLPAVTFLMLFWGLIGFWSGSTAARPALKEQKKSAWLNGLVAGSLMGLLVGLFTLGIGLAYANGVDFRSYLDALSKDNVNFFLFNLAAVPASAIYVGLFSLSGLLGAVIAQLWHFGSVGAWLGRTWTAVRNQHWLERIRSNRVVVAVVFVVLVGLCFFLPRQWGSYWNYVFGLVGIYVILGLGLNIIVGLSGQLVLGYAAFFAIGAYTMALLNAPEPHHLLWGFWIALALGVVLAALAGILIGLPLMRLRGDYLAIVTLGFGEIIRILLKSDLLSNFTGGPRGIQDIKGPVLFGVPFNSDVDFMYLILVAALLALFVANRLQHSRTGRAWIAIREDETVARASGVNTVWFKLLALALGAALAGLGGGLFAARNQFTGPEDHVLMVSINVLSIVIVGGTGSLPGVILGAFALKGLPEVLREISNFRLLVFGALLVSMMIMRPQGLWPVGRDKLEKKADAAEKPKEGEPL